MLSYDEAGGGGCVLLLHAGVTDRRMWHGHLQPLADAGFRAVALDLPGFGDVPVDASGEAPWEAVLRAMKDLGIASAALVGNSFGAAVAMRVAAIAPVAVSALVLVSPPPLEGEPSPSLAAAWQAEEKALERGDIDAAVAAVVAHWTLPTASAELRESVGMMQRRAFALQSAAPEVPGTADPLEENPDALGRLTMPTLALAGEHDMPDFKRGAEEIATVLPDARFALIEAAGHLAPLETPDAFRSLLVRFLEGHGAP